MASEFINEGINEITREYGNGINLFNISVGLNSNFFSGLLTSKSANVFTSRFAGHKIVLI